MPGSVCIIGCGYISRTHIEAYRGYPESIAVTLCDVDLEKAESIGKQFGVQSYFQDYREVLEQKNVEIVDICLPNFLHEEVAVAALNAGKHVLLEKPIATTLSGADAIIAAARASAGPRRRRCSLQGPAAGPRRPPLPFATGAHVNLHS